MTRFDRMYTFVYHRDLERADWFYGGLLGLEMEPESDWVNLYRVSEGATIGVVQDGRGFLRVSDDKPVILCLGVPDDGDIWEVYRRLKENGVKDIYVVSTHAVFCGEAYKRLSSGLIKEVAVTNTIPLDKQWEQGADATGTMPIDETWVRRNIKVLSVAPLLGEAIRRIHRNESVSSLFDSRFAVN